MNVSIYQCKVSIIYVYSFSKGFLNSVHNIFLAEYVCWDSMHHRLINVHQKNPFRVRNNQTKQCSKQIKSFNNLWEEKGVNKFCYFESQIIWSWKELRLECFYLKYALTRISLIGDVDRGWKITKERHIGNFK